MRHAHAEPFATLGDKLRPLDDLGRTQAATIGAALRDAGVNYVLTSSAARTRQTVATMALGAEVEALDALYEGGTGTVVDRIRGVDDAVTVLLVVGHNPAIAAAVYRLMDQDRSDADAMALVATHFPTATCAELQFEGSWPELRRARLVRVLRTKYPK
jgi:phosphohistidine phosphatase